MDASSSRTRTLSQERLEVCRECVFLFKPTMTCKRCGCFMKVKTHLAHAECPEGKWAR
jgi:Family of unknown function (DUF6171)